MWIYYANDVVFGDVIFGTNFETDDVVVLLDLYEFGGSSNKAKKMTCLIDIELPLSSAKEW